MKVVTRFQISLRFLGVALLPVLMTGADLALAQSITITSPVATTNVQEGDDYATTVLQNPWDMNQRRDVGWEEGYSNIAISNGQWTTTSFGSGAYFLPLFGGFIRALNVEGPSGDTETPKMGILHPIDAAKYTRLSYRLNVSSRSTVAVYWNGDDTNSYWPGADFYGATFDGLYHSNAAFSNSGYRVYDWDMPNRASEFSNGAGTWANSVYALRIDPSISAPAGSTTAVDWIRLVDPTSAPNFTLTWSSSGLTPNRLMTVFVDDNNSGYDGTPLYDISTTSAADPGSYTFPSAILPPGTWYFYVKSSVGNSSLTQEAVSAYSPALVINSAPQAYFTAPTETSGEDYATAVLGNSWDMSDSADVANLPGSAWPAQWRQFFGENFTNGVFSAYADLPWTSIGNAETDVQVHLNVSNRKPIDTSKYRYLNYRISADNSQFPTLAYAVEHGWVTRPVFWDTHLFHGGGRAYAHVLYEGMKTYSVDMWADDSMLLEWGKNWKYNHKVSHLRLDPLETDIYTWFYLDWATLTAENRTTNGSYEIKFIIADADDSSFSASLYYDTDKSGFNGTLITTLNGLSAGEHTYNWTPSGLVNDSSYYVYVVVSDGTNSSRFYAPVPVVMGEFVAVPRLLRVPLDYDGDGQSDPTIYRITSKDTKVSKPKKKKKQPKKKKKKKKTKKKTSKLVAAAAQESGIFHMSYSRQPRGAEEPTTQHLGGPKFLPITGDFNGDGQTDFATYTVVGKKLYFYIAHSNGDVKAVYCGKKGERVVVGDYDGDFSDQLATFSNGVWTILAADGVTTNTYTWGAAGDEPVPGDYDKDGLTDLAVWRPSNGTWYILNSGYSSGKTATASTEINFGVNKDIPMQADWNSDGDTDIAVWRPSNGTWYIYDVGTGQTSFAQFGLSTDRPIPGDFNRGGLMDFAVFRPSTGQWLAQCREAGCSPIATQTFGKASDLLPINDAHKY